MDYSEKACQDLTTSIMFINSPRQSAFVFARLHYQKKITHLLWVDFRCVKDWKIEVLAVNVILKNLVHKRTS